MQSYDQHDLIILCSTALIFLLTARTVCGVNSCSHICAVIEGQDECFCHVGFELSAGSTTTCEGTIEATA